MIDKSRKNALTVLNEIIKTDAYSNLALKSAFYGLNPQEKRFATRLVYGTLEKLITIDWIIDNYVNKRTALTLKNILRMGTYQIYYMDSVPDRASCATSVELAKSIGKGGASGFINGVLRNISRNKDKLQFPDIKKDKILSLSVNYSFPQWLVKMWISELGEDTAIALLSHTETNDIIIRPNSAKSLTLDELKKELDNRGINYSEGHVVEDALHISASFDEIEKGLFDSGKIAIQDEGSMLIAKTVVGTNSKDVLDACAAPGGKTAAIKHFSKDKSISCYALELHKHRVDIMEKELNRLGIDAKCYRHDSSKDTFTPKVDCVLVDAPCSGLGTIFKQPDIRAKKTSEDITSLSHLQYEILENCSKSVNDNGYLIYSTCTISQRENKDIVKKFIENNPQFSIVPPSYDNEELNKCFDGYGIQLLPSVHGTAGFYISKMKLNNSQN